MPTSSFVPPQFNRRRFLSAGASGIIGPLVAVSAAEAAGAQEAPEGDPREFLALPTRTGRLHLQVSARPASKNMPNGRRTASARMP